MEREVYNRTESENVKDLQTKIMNLKVQLDQANNKYSSAELSQKAKDKTRKEQMEEKDRRIRELEEKMEEVRGDKSQADNKLFYWRGCPILWQHR